MRSWGALLPAANDIARALADKGSLRLQPSGAYAGLDRRYHASHRKREGESPFCYPLGKFQSIC
jgi:hypothetical protein